MLPIKEDKKLLVFDFDGTITHDYRREKDNFGFLWFSLPHEHTDTGVVACNVAGVRYRHGLAKTNAEYLATYSRLAFGAMLLGPVHLLSKKVNPRYIDVLRQLSNKYFLEGTPKESLDKAVDEFIERKKQPEGYNIDLLETIKKHREMYGSHAVIISSTWSSIADKLLTEIGYRDIFSEIIANTMMFDVNNGRKSAIGLTGNVCGNKLEHLREVMQRYGVGREEIAYGGNENDDLACLLEAGQAIIPPCSELELIRHFEGTNFDGKDKPIIQQQLIIN